MTLPARLPDDTAESKFGPVEDSVEPPERDSFSPLTFFAVIGVTSLVIILCVLGAAFSGLFSFGDAAEDASSMSAEVADSLPATSMDDGQWLVGTDIQPGTYSVTVVADSPGCSWERNSSTDGTAASVLERGVGDEGDTIAVVIHESDVIFQSRNCGHWELVAEVPSD